MSRWEDRRGVTLALRTSRTGDARAHGAAASNAQDAAPPNETGTSSVGARFVRVVLAERLGLISAWNVRESRAEPDEAGIPRAVGSGRFVSWRWLHHAGAERLFERTVSTLESLGYEALAEPEAANRERSTWDWLNDLVQHSLEASRETQGREAGGRRREHSAILDALERLGLPAEDVLDGLAHVTSLHRARFEHPDPETISRVDPSLLAVLLPPIVAHGDPRVREVGLRWVDAPTTLFELDPAVVERWLRTDSPLARHLAPRLRTQGLALLGASRLRTLAQESACEPVRDEAALWRDRLSPLLSP